MTAQFERLKQDVVELENYITKLETRGNKDLVSKIVNKRDYLVNYITEKHKSLQ